MTSEDFRETRTNSALAIVLGVLMVLLGIAAIAEPFGWNSIHYQCSGCCS
ncbi:hypothetical protein [Nostoc sp.]